MADDTSNGDDTPPWFDPDTSVGDSSTDVLVGVLADRRTRNVVSALESGSVNVIELDDLASKVVQVEQELDDNRGSGNRGESANDRESVNDCEEHRRRVEIDLHHRSLPKLDDAALLDYDPRSNTVRYWDDPRVSSYLDLLGNDGEF